MWDLHRKPRWVLPLVAAVLCLSGAYALLSRRAPSSHALTPTSLVESVPAEKPFAIVATATPAASPSPSARPESASPKESSTAQTSPADWRQEEANLPGAKSSRSVEEFLEAVQVPDLDEEFEKSQVLTQAPENFPDLQGRYSGLARVGEGKRRILQVTLEMNARFASGGPEGEIRIEVMNNGHLISNASDSGEITRFRRFAGASSAILVELAPSIYAQLYPVDQRSRLVGNVYVRDPGSEFIYYGIIQLNRE